MTKYVVSGTVKKGKFSIEVEARSEKHARELAITRLGSAQKLKGTSIKVAQVVQK